MTHANHQGEPGDTGTGGGLDERMRAAGMLTIPEMMGTLPLDRWRVHAGMTDLDAFGRWLDRKAEEYARRRAPYELGEKDQSDELYEWMLAHAAVFSEVRVNFRAALPAGAGGDLASAIAAEIMGLGWALPEFRGDEEETEEECDRRHGQVQHAVEAVLARSGKLVALGTEARSVETFGLGPKDDGPADLSATPEATPQQSPSPTTETDPPMSVEANPPRWRDLKWCQANYPHLKWTISGEPSKPVWWDDEYGWTYPHNCLPPMASEQHKRGM